MKQIPNNLNAVPLRRIEYGQHGREIILSRLRLDQVPPQPFSRREHAEGVQALEILLGEEIVARRSHEVEPSSGLEHVSRTFETCLPETPE